MVKNLSNFLVERRYIIGVVMLVLTVLCAFGAAKVETNTDMTKYLSSDSQMSQGLEIIESDFPKTSEQSGIRVMFDDLTQVQKDEVFASLQRIDGVDSVEYSANSADYNKDNHTLFIVKTSFDYGSKEELSIEAAIESNYSNYSMVYQNNGIVQTEVPLWLLLTALGLLLAILLAVGRSWLEPFLFLAVTGIAVVINLGTNLILGYVSALTMSIAPILQLVLSMDYSIMLMSRYREERQKTNDKKQAMKAALAGSFSSIMSSSLTTVVGLAVLAVLSFKMGPEIGIVLAKGVLISMLCVLTLLPALILLCDKGIEKTAKKTLPLYMAWLGRFGHGARKIIPILFALMLIGTGILQSFTPIDFSEGNEDIMADVFPRDNTTVLVYDNRDEGSIDLLLSSLDGNEHIKSITAYSNTLAKKYNSEEMAEVAAQMGGITLDSTVLEMLYYKSFDGELHPMTLAAFSESLQKISVNPTLQKYLGEGMAAAAGQLGTIETLVEPSALTALYSPDELCALLLRLDCKVTAEQMSVLYLFASSQTEYDATWKMTVSQLFEQLSDPIISNMLDENALASLDELRTQLDDAARQLKGETYSRLIIVTDLPVESENTEQFYRSLDAARVDYLSQKSYLVGSSAMVYELQSDFSKEYLIITLITAAVIFLVVAITFRSLWVPLVLVLLVQGSVFVTVSAIGIVGNSMYYLALLIVQSILMGATIDYAIVLTGYYREYRTAMGIKDALAAALHSSAHTILTSGSILVLVTAVLGIFTVQLTSQVLTTISIGALTSILLIMFVLPSILAMFDRGIAKNVRLGKSYANRDEE
ncbi:MAG: MMPL family transporter [Eubacteriales bacterium]|nr:MMPL family transporter [Eubacteriales bacterium]